VQPKVPGKLRWFRSKFGNNLNVKPKPALLSATKTSHSDVGQTWILIMGKWWSMRVLTMCWNPLQLTLEQQGRSGGPRRPRVSRESHKRTCHCPTCHTLMRIGSSIQSRSPYLLQSQASWGASYHAHVSIVHQGATPRSEVRM
jgi:hypothetical protein